MKAARPELVPPGRVGGGGSPSPAGQAGPGCCSQLWEKPRRAPLSWTARTVTGGTIVREVSRVFVFGAWNRCAEDSWWD